MQYLGKTNVTQILVRGTRRYMRVLEAVRTAFVRQRFRISGYVCKRVTWHSTRLANLAASGKFVIEIFTNQLSSRWIRYILLSLLFLQCHCYIEISIRPSSKKMFVQLFTEFLILCWHTGSFWPWLCFWAYLAGVEKYFLKTAIDFSSELNNSFSKRAKSTDLTN